MDQSMSLWNRRQNLAQGVGSEVSGTLGTAPKIISKPALAGDKICTISILSPAKAGLVIDTVTNPGFRSLRSLHPGLYSSACSAGSLNRRPPVARFQTNRVM